MTDSVLKGVIATLLYALVMSVTGMMAKLVQVDIALSSLLFWQSCICLLILIPQQRKQWRLPPMATLKIHFLRSLAGFFGFYFYYLALNYIPLMEASLLRASAPLCVPFAVLTMHRISIPISRWLPLLIGFLGVAFIIQPVSMQINPWHVVGFMSAIGLAFSMVTTRLLSKSVRPQETMIMYFLISACIALIMTLYRGESLLFPIELLLPVLVVGITLYIGMHLYTMAYSYAPASIVSPVSYIGVAFSGLWGWWLWQDIPDVWEYLGMTLILGSIVLTAVIHTKNSP